MLGKNLRKKYDSLLPYAVPYPVLTFCGFVRDTEQLFVLGFWSECNGHKFFLKESSGMGKQSGEFFVRQKSRCTGKTQDIFWNI